MQCYSFNYLHLYVLNLLLALTQTYLLVAQFEGEFLAHLLHGHHGRVIVECCQSGYVAILHLRKVEYYGACTLGTFHTLSQCVGGQIQVGHYAAGLQAQVTWALGQAPGLIHGVVVPLPVQA